MRVALVSREIAPLVGGGLAPYVTELANLLSREPDVEVTLITTDLHAERLEELRAARDPRLPAPGVRTILVPEPREQGTWFNKLHAYAGAALTALRDAYADGAPDLVEVPDYHAEGAAIVQAAYTREPFLRGTTVATRAYTTAEMCHVLNGHVWRDVIGRSVYELERYGVRYADAFVHGGGDVHGTYERFYGAGHVAPERRIRHPLRTEGIEPGPPPPGPKDGEPLRLLYMGRLERRKGVENLVRALTADTRDDWRLTLVGGDTETAPLGQSMREQLALMIGGDPRFDLREPVPPAEVPDLVAGHHAIVMPSLWECWPNVALEALRANRPVIATPVGGLREIVGAPGDGGGVLAAGASAEDLFDTLEAILDAPAQIEDLIADGAPARRLPLLSDEREIVAAYRDLAAERPRDTRRAAARAQPPLVSVVVPYFHLPEYVEQTVRSALDQTHPRIEVVVVNDGSEEAEDAILDELAELPGVRVAHQSNTGLGAARNLGIALARGRYVVPLDADDVLEPHYVERCLPLLEEDDSVAYVCCWTRYVDEDLNPIDIPGDGYNPYGNAWDLVHDLNVAGHATSILRRRLFEIGFAYEQDLTSYEDWMLYRDLHDAGWIGHVVPERLMSYRVRATSMLRGVEEERKKRLAGETEAHRRRRAIAWTP